MAKEKQDIDSNTEVDNFTTEFKIEEKPSKPVNSIANERRQSGYCHGCRQRYTDVPVIDGQPQCPRCNKL